jgi:hypothetical protein
VGTFLRKMNLSLKRKNLRFNATCRPLPYFLALSLGEFDKVDGMLLG